MKVHLACGIVILQAVFHNAVAYFLSKGGASVLDYLDAERTYRATQLAYHQQLPTYLNALAQLQSAAGLDLTP